MQVKTKLAEVPVGKNFRVWGREYTLLRSDGEHTLVLQNGIEHEMPFQTDDGREDAWNDFSRSEIRKWLETEYIQRLRNDGMEDGDIHPLTVDLKCTLGQHEYGTVEVMAGLLTLEQYGEFYDLIPKEVDDWWWLATPWKTPLRSPLTYYTTNAWYVYSNGNCSSDYCTNTSGVRPALDMDSSLLVSWEKDDEEEETKDEVNINLRDMIADEVEYREIEDEEIVDKALRYIRGSDRLMQLLDIAVNAAIDQFID